MTTITYGDLPGVQATVKGGRIVDVSIGYEQHVVLFGRGNPVDGTATANTPELVQTPAEADTLFGEGSRLAAGLRGALRNGANRDYLHGVMPTETTVSAEPIAGGSGTLTNVPLVEDIDTITVTNTTAAGTATPEFVYSSPPPAPGEAGVVNINPLTGEVASGGTDDYQIDYAYLDWGAALDAADTVLRHNETGIYATLTDAEVVAQTLSDKLDTLRPTYKLVRGIAGAQPNTTNPDGEAIIGTDVDDTTPDYTDTLDDDALFLAGPTRLAGTEDTRTILGGLAGKMGGNAITDPVYGDVIEGYGPLVQQLSPEDEGTPAEDNTLGTGLRGQQVMPIRDDGSDGGMGLTIEDTLSTSTLSDWERDYFNRRIVDQMLITAREIGEPLRGRRLRDAITSNAEQDIVDALAGYADDGLLEQSSAEGTSNTGTTNADDEEQNYDAIITRPDRNSVAISIYFTPIGVAKNIEETLFVGRAPPDEEEAATP